MLGKKLQDHLAREAGRQAGWMGIFLILSSLTGFCNMAKHHISAYPTLQLSPTSKVSVDKQEAKCKLVKRIKRLFFQKVAWIPIWLIKWINQCVALKLMMIYQIYAKIYISFKKKWSNRSELKQLVLWLLETGVCVLETSHPGLLVFRTVHAACS